MNGSFLQIIFCFVIGCAIFCSSQVLAAPTLFQCTLPSATVGPLEPKTPAPLPKSGELVIKFQRALGESTQSKINLAEMKGHNQFLDLIVKIISDEVTQRLPKMAAIRERGMDDIKSLTLGSTRFLLINELLRILMVYNPEEIQAIFDGSAVGGYTPICNALAPMREVPSFGEITFESQPKILFIAFPERVRGGQSTTGAFIYADKEDDMNSLGIRYRSEDSSVRDFVVIPYETLPAASPFGPGLKAVKFSLTVPCDSPLAFEATAFISDKTGLNSEFFTFKFVCER